MPDNPIIKIYSHPRSGTHLLGHLMKLNLYKEVNLSTGPGSYGHWADRRHSMGSPVGQLFGHHMADAPPTGPAIYLVRDGRDVAISIFRTPHFMNPNVRILGFSEFLRILLDWKWSPSNRVEFEYTITQNWYEHVKAWGMFACTSDVCVVRYEDLVLRPNHVLGQLVQWFDLKRCGDFEPVKGLVGVSPNDGKIGRWRRMFSPTDLSYFHQMVPRDFNMLWGTNA